MAKKIRFKYKFSEDYNPVYVNGVYGGVGTAGELIANFYLERTPIQKEEIRDILPDNSLGDVLQDEQHETSLQIIRFVPAGIIMNLDVAKSVYNWLGEHIKNAEAQKGA
ncbi:MAG: hypothetical protein WCI01_03680 [Chlorobiaceae bacterium]